MQFWALLSDSFRESLDRKIFWVLLTITLLVILMMLSVGFQKNQVTFVFGLWSVSTTDFNPLIQMGRSRIAGIIVYFVLNFILGWIGMILMIIATAGMFPSFMERGAVDVLLSKPLTRYRLFLYKYLASMIFVLVQAAVFVGSTFTIMGLRWGVWIPGYLMCIPLMVLLFSYVFCISVFVAVKTRSTIAAILLSLGAWIVFTIPPTARDSIEQHYPEVKAKHVEIYRMIETLAWIVPKTHETPYLAARWAQAGSSLDMFPDSTMESAAPDDRAQIERMREFERGLLTINPLLSIGSSLLFEAAVVALAMWIFARKDF